MILTLSHIQHANKWMHVPKVLITGTANMTGILQFLGLFCLVNEKVINMPVDFLISIIIVLYMIHGKR